MVIIHNPTNSFVATLSVMNLKECKKSGEITNKNVLYSRINKIKVIILSAFLSCWILRSS